MKTFRLLIAVGLAMTALVGVVLALTWWQPASARAEDAVNAPAAPQALPPPYLSDDDVADAPYDNPPSPNVDGRIDPGEYAGAGKVTFPGYGGDVEVFFKQDAITLYVAFELPDKVNKNPWPNASIFLDTNHDGGNDPQPDDFRFLVWRNGPAAEWQGNGSTWISNSAITWTYGLAETMSGWSVEFGIPFTKLGISAGNFKVLGLALGNSGLTPEYYWPDGVAASQPGTWGSLASSSGDSSAVPSGWDTFYWKPGPWEDYAPSGMPDFDQMQVGIGYCGPFAAADSLWWFDSKFEENPVGPTGPTPTLPISDSYMLVWPYGPWDDHDPQNVVSLTLDLGKYFGTNQGGILGTNVYSMYHGIQTYLRDHDLWDDYIVTLVNQPEFDWITDEVMRSEDVILLLGFYEELGPDYWNRIGGHFVTVAGIDPTPGVERLAFSDPAQDYAEATGMGRVLSGTLIPHQPITHTGIYTLHNDAGNISHDVYMVFSDSVSPGGSWWIPEYEVPPIFLDLPGLNPNPKWEEPPVPWGGGTIHTEIEYVLAVSPYTWKASGRWVEAEDVELYGRRFEPYEDFAPSGVPDFDQKQDLWGRDTGLGWQWSHCGPAAAANSLWWFDSKFEPDPSLPPDNSDNYWLVSSYGPWDDHHPDNVQPFVNDLAWLADTNGQRTGIVHAGTVVTDLYNAILTFTAELRQGYVITRVHQPEFWWVAEEVERSEDVILLLGFYADFGGFYERAGGHYVTLPGVDKKGGFVAFSDPYWDRMETLLPPREFVGWPLWTGRVGSDGDPPLGPSGLVPTYTHTPLPHTGVYTLHNDAANVSHDVYRVITSTSPGGVWGPADYVSATEEITNFFEMNGGGSYIEPGWPIQTEVEWAVAVSPVADVAVKKTVTPTTVVPGEWVTYTIYYGNYGNLAENVVISDILPPGLISPSVVGTWNNYGGNIVTYDTFTWTVGSVPFWNWVWPQGIITITAQVDPSLSWPAQTTITNTVEITTTTQEQYQVPALPDSASAFFTVQTADVAITKTMGPLVGLFRPGDWITFTLVYSNAGPATAASVVITDLLPTPPLTTTGAWYTYTNNYGGILAQVIGPLFVWNAGDLAAGNAGLITITAQVDPNLTSGGRFTNTAEIATSTSEHDLTNNRAEQGFDVCIPPAGATFVYTPPVPVVNQPITFTGSVTQGTPVAYTWDFDDTTTGSGNPVTHTYNGPGAYTVWMTATNTCGRDTYSDTISVCEPVSNASIQYMPADPEVTQAIHFTATATGSGVITYAWAADDSWTDTGPTATHAFATRGNHTVWLTATNDCGQATTSTVVFVREYGVSLTPPTDQQTDKPGAVVTYTLTVHNTGNVSDTYDITATVSNQPWTTTWPSTVGPVTGGGNQQFDVTVQISSTGVNDGDWSRATITATSQHDLSKSDSSVLTTTVTTQPITRGVEITPPTDADSGSAGADVVYHLTVTNTGSVADTINLGAGGYNWPTAVSPGSVSLPSMGSSPVIVTVTIPSTATHGQFDVATITAQATGVSDSSVLTTTTVYTADLAITKTMVIAGLLQPGDWVTFTLAYANAGPATAASVVITDPLPIPPLTSTGVLTTYTNNYGGILTPTLGFTFVWNAGNLAMGNAGLITITAQVDPNLTSGGRFTNTAEIAALVCDPDPSNNQSKQGLDVCVPPASAAFTYTPSAPVPNQMVTFTGSVLAGDPPFTYDWDFGDNTVGSSNPVTHTYIQSGTYTVWMTATNSCGWDVISHSLIVTGTPFVPVYGAVLTPTARSAPADPGDTVIYTHTLRNTGNVADTYTVTVSSTQGWATLTSPGTVSLAHGSTAVVTVSVPVPLTATAGMTDVATVQATSHTSPTVQVQAMDTTTVICTLPAGAGFNWSPGQPKTGQTVHFTGTVASGSPPLTYTWAADDGWSASGITATHAFSTMGNHTVWLTATNSCGQDHASQVIFVRGYGVYLQPPSGGTTGKQGSVITYTLTLFNTGNVTDDYTITGSVTGEPWPTNWPATVSSVAGGGSAQLNVTVQITSASGASHAVITATSQSDTSKRATSVLTTTATTQPLLRGVDIAPHTAAQKGDVETIVTYTLRVTNTGIITDYLNLSVSGPNWGTTLSAYGFNLKPGEGQSVEAYVQIPAGESSGAQDVATIIARSSGDPTVADSAILTTTAYVPTYGVDLTPLIAQQDGHPGDVMTYTLTVRNTGERADTYTLSKAGNTWPTTLSVPSVGPLDPNNTAQFDVTVQIPVTTTGGTFDTVQVTATSQKDGSKNDTAVLTTTAIASSQPITRGVVLAAADLALEGPLGTWVTYTLRLTNTGTAADFFNLTRQGNTWPVDLSIHGLSLGAGLGADVQAYVWVPTTASGGDTDTVTIKGTSANDTLATDDVTLTTKARSYQIYLPLVVRNYP